MITVMGATSLWRCKRTDHHVLPGHQRPHARGVRKVAALDAQVCILLRHLGRVAGDRGHRVATPEGLGQHPLPDHSRRTEKYEFHTDLP